MMRGSAARLTAIPEDDMPDFVPDDVPRAVSTVGMELVTRGYQLAPHRHRKAELLFSVSGIVRCEVANGLWMVPPQCALWVPGGREHSVRGAGSLALYALFVEPEVVPLLPTECCTMAVSPLLRELLIAASRLPTLYDQHGPAGRLVHTMLDELITAPLEHLHVPMPDDQRLRRIAAGIERDPADRASAGEWARRVGMSERSLFRLVSTQTGMTFHRWRRQIQIMIALERMAEGATVQTAAFDLGFEGASSFITMFRKALGESPAKYLAARHGRLRNLHRSRARNGETAAATT